MTVEVLSLFCPKL